MDLVDEHDLALVEVREHRGEVAGAFERGARGDSDRFAQFGGDDHGEAGLAEAGRAGEQDVVGRGTASGGALQHEFELFAHAGLADELREQTRPQRRLVVAFTGNGDRGDLGLQVLIGRDPLVRVHLGLH